MLTTLTVASARGFRLNDPDGGYCDIRNVDPYNRIVLWDGLSYYGTGKDRYSDPVAGMMTWDEIKAKYGVEIVPTPEEAAMIERGRLGHLVLKKAKELTEAVDAWLANENRR